MPDLEERVLVLERRLREAEEREQGLRVAANAAIEAERDRSRRLQAQLHARPEPPQIEGVSPFGRKVTRALIDRIIADGAPRLRDSLADCPDCLHSRAFGELAVLVEGALADAHQHGDEGRA